VGHLDTLLATPCDQRDTQIPQVPLARRITKATLVPQMGVEEPKRRLDRRHLDRCSRRRRQATPFAQRVEHVGRDRNEVFASGPRWRAGAVSGVLPRELLEAIGREPIQRDLSALDAPGEMRGAPHVPRQRPGTMTPRLQVPGQHLQIL